MSRQLYDGMRFMCPCCGLEIRWNEMQATFEPLKALTFKPPEPLSKPRPWYFFKRAKP